MQCEPNGCSAGGTTALARLLLERRQTPGMLLWPHMIRQRRRRRQDCPDGHSHLARGGHCVHRKPVSTARRMRCRQRRPGVELRGSGSTRHGGSSRRCNDSLDKQSRPDGPSLVRMRSSRLRRQRRRSGVSFGQRCVCRCVSSLFPERLVLLSGSVWMHAQHARMQHGTLPFFFFVRRLEVWVSARTACVVEVLCPNGWFLKKAPR
jgi:hypothetical protein